MQERLSAEDPDSGVYYISFRPISPDPVPHPSWIGAWSPEVSVLATIQDERETIYQWTGLALPLGGDGAEGTTRRPIVYQGPPRTFAPIPLWRLVEDGAL